MYNLRDKMICVVHICDLFVLVPYIKCVTFIGAFDDDEVTHVEGDVNPIRDLEIIFEELRKKDEEFLTKTTEHMQKSARGADKAKKLEYVSSTLLLFCHNPLSIWCSMFHRVEIYLVFCDSLACNL